MRPLHPLRQDVRTHARADHIAPAVAFSTLNTITISSNKARPRRFLPPAKSGRCGATVRFCPLSRRRPLPPLRVGATPLYDVPRLAKAAGIARLWLKDDGLNPTASLKDRASALAVVKAREAGAHTVACSSTGNAASSLGGQRGGGRPACGDLCAFARAAGKGGAAAHLWRDGDQRGGAATRIRSASRRRPLRNTVGITATPPSIRT